MRQCLRYRPAIISLTGNSSHSTFSHVVDSDNAPETRSRASHSFLPRRYHIPSASGMSQLVTHAAQAPLPAPPGNIYQIYEPGAKNILFLSVPPVVYTPPLVRLPPTHECLDLTPLKSLAGHSGASSWGTEIHFIVPSLVFLHQDQ